VSYLALEAPGAERVVGTVVGATLCSVAVITLVWD
jgi:hypothetical protein